ncbi:alpha-hydroxy acid oxidase [Amorphus sp. 3PC139-8]|uniref:alpha-hydroxy acid oxidase n=1 Tax=Amorphus sp. 3PC139-8 TaxID=2735676 RepID=UPI00345CF6F1
MKTLTEIVVEARRRLEPSAWNYLMGGADSEATLLRNRQALDMLTLCPLVLNDVSSVSTEAEFLGRRVAAPFFLAPIGSLALLHGDGVLASAAAAAQFGVPCFVSIMSRPHFRDVASTVDGDLILQIYARGDGTWLLRQSDMAADAGFKAVCLTVDTAWYGRRERDLAFGFAPVEAVDRPAVADRVGVEGDLCQARFDWRGLEAFIARSSLPVIVKGVQRGDDARRLRDLGAAAIYLSNHGGRQLDHARAPIDVLQEVGRDLSGRVDVFVDSGFMRGADILKAVALGARGVGLGKLQGLSLACGGQPSLFRALNILQTELSHSMALCGATSLQQVTADLVAPALPFAAPRSIVSISPEAWASAIGPDTADGGFTDGVTTS